MERTNVWAKRAHSRDTRDSGDMKSESVPPLSGSAFSSTKLYLAKSLGYLDQVSAKTVITQVVGIS